MRSQFIRSLSIFYLALSLLGDYWRMRWLERRPDTPRRARAAARIYTHSGARVRRAAFRLGGLIIKVGQFLSARTDVLPVAFTRELTQLQDAVPGVKFRKVKPAVERELGAHLSSVFQEFSQAPIAAASLGQVHKAVLTNGQVVAVKVLRPGIERLARIDLSALKKVAWVLERLTGFGRRMHIGSLYFEFANMVEQELDYRLEADNLRRFARQAAADNRIVVPRVEGELVTKRVLVMEYMDGAKITDVAQFEEYGAEPKQIVETLIDSYLRQLLVEGFVHVDPHPGNLLVLRTGQVCFLDFGMMSELPKAAVQSFAKLIRAAIADDIDTIIDAIDELGFLQPHANRQFLKRALRFMLDRITGIKLQRGPELEQFITDFQTFLHDEPLVLQARYMFLGRALGIFSGVVTSIQPAIDWQDILKRRALPLLTAQLHAHETERKNWKEPFRRFASSWFGEQAGIATDFALQQAQQTAASLVRLPTEFERVLQKAEQGNLVIRLELDDVLERLDYQERLFVRGIWSVLAITSGIAGLWLQTRHFYIEADIALMLTSVFVLFVFINSLTYRRRKRKRHLRK